VPTANFEGQASSKGGGTPNRGREGFKPSPWQTIAACEGKNILGEGNKTEKPSVSAGQGRKKKGGGCQPQPVKRNLIFRTRDLRRQKE